MSSEKKKIKKASFLAKYLPITQSYLPLLNLLLNKQEECYKFCEGRFQGARKGQLNIWWICFWSV